MKDDAARSASSRRRSREEAMARLMAGADFGEWLFGVMHNLCAFEHDLRRIDDFEQGIRAAAAYIRRDLLAADGAVEFFAELDRRYLSGLKHGIAASADNDVLDRSKTK